jgi:hypothetical protein
MEWRRRPLGGGQHGVLSVTEFGTNPCRRLSRYSGALPETELSQWAKEFRGDDFEAPGENRQEHQQCKKTRKQEKESKEEAPEALRRYAATE